MASPIFVDLVLDTGDLIRIECPGRHGDEFYDSLNDAQKRRDDWAPGQFDGCHALFLGHRLDRINMARVVGRM